VDLERSTSKPLAAEKRQGTKSWEVRRRPSSERYGDLIPAPSFVAPTPNVLQVFLVNVSWTIRIRHDEVVNGGLQPDWFSRASSSVMADRWGASPRLTPRANSLVSR